jgi:hypothetical protein
MLSLSRVIVVINAAMMLGISAPALAVLGQPAQTVGSDAQAVGSRVHTLAQGPAQTPYTVQQFTTPARIEVREYVSPDGTVFAVAWNGPHPPDLAALLGSYFTDYKSMAAQTQGSYGLHHQSLHGDRLVIQSGGHMGDMWGRAWDPQLLPSGVGEEEIK